ncbi:MAG: triose-phosphate isomerase [Patescibacteria group bacterium]
MDKKIIVANWKMNPQMLPEAEDLFRVSGNAIVCPPFVYIEALSKIDSEAVLGAQDCHWEDEGAFTGEVSAKMLKNLGVRYVIIGHSERRWIFGETDEIINKKLEAVLRNDLTPILAVGERNKSDKREEILTSQLKADLDGVDSAKIIIAYEPVWAIGSGDAETPEHTIEAVKIIKSVVGDAPVLYGGSVDPRNVGDFISKPEIAGVLIGGASVDKEEFRKIMEIVSNV